jgi:uncharacterized protein YbjT (DUF2867 family)
MTTGSENSAGHRVTPVSVDDVARVVNRALSERTWRIRLTSGQRLAILHAPVRVGPGAARA